MCLLGGFVKNSTTHYPQNSKIVHDEGRYSLKTLERVGLSATKMLSRVGNNAQNLPLLA